MRDDEKGGARHSPSLEQEVKNGRTRLRIEIPGRLVGEQELGLGRRCPCNGDTLLLPARKLAGIVGNSVAKPDRLQLRLCSFERLIAAGKLQRNRDIFLRGHGREQVKGLKDDANPALPSPGKVVFVKRGEIGSADSDPPRGCAFQSRKHCHQGGFTGARWPKQRNAFAFRDFKIDAAKDIDPSRSGAQGQGDVLGVDHVGVGHEGKGDPMVLRLPYGAVRLLVQLGFAMTLGVSAPAAGQDVHVLAFGDSLTAGYGLPAGQGFAPQLEDTLRRNGIRAHVTNAGVSGNTAGQGRARLRWTLDGLKVKPDLAIVALGANDMLRGLPPSRTREDLDAIMAEFKRRDIPVVMAGMLAPPNLGLRFMTEYNGIFPDLARRYDAALYPFFLAGVAGDPALNLPDRVHPNFQGIKRMVGGIAPTVIRALAR